MRNKLAAGIATSFAVVALAAMPAVAQAVPHWYSNLAKIEEGRRVPYIAWGQLVEAWTNGALGFECDNAVGGYVENPVGGGPGIDDGWVMYNCVSPPFQGPCSWDSESGEYMLGNERTPGVATKLEWPGELTEAKNGTVRLKSTNVSIFGYCRSPAQSMGPAPIERAGTGQFEGLEEREVKEYSDGQETCTTGPPGVWEPRVKDGTNAGKPTKFEFTEGTELECGEAGKPFFYGPLKVLGSAESENITVKSP